MEPARAAAARGVGWIADGWRAFKASPGMWVVLVVVWALVLAALQLVPFVGLLAVHLMAPALAGGLLLCVADGLAGRPLDVGRLFDPLASDRSRGPMLVLGALFLVANLVVLALAGALLVATVGMSLLEHHEVLLAPGGPDPAAIDPALVMRAGLGVALAALAALALSLVVWVLFFYAIPLVLLAGAEPGAAIAASVRGVLRNWLPLLVFSILWSVLALLATLPLMLGWLLLLPISFGAWHASWRDVFPAAASPAGPVETGAVPAG